MEGRVNVGRIAFRIEAEMWVAYWAPSETSLEGRILLGSIRMSAVAENNERKKEFIDLMTSFVHEAITDVTGQSATFDDLRPAPESERGRTG